MNRYLPLLLVMVAGTLMFLSCAIETESPDPPQLKPAGHIVINEVFVLPETNQNHFSWIEFYNPTDNVVEFDTYKLNFFVQGQIIVQLVVRDTARGIISNTFINGPYDVPLTFTGRVGPSEFCTIVDREDRMLTYTSYGPGFGPKVDLSLFGGAYFKLDTVRLSTDSIHLVTTALLLKFKTTDQFILKDSSNNVVDVVRYGNYQWTDTSMADPFPGNRSKGIIPEYQSIARYAGAYSTGNTATDFYVTEVEEPQTRPIPHWLSRAYKK